jgi:hypothetical protein
MKLWFVLLAAILLVVGALGASAYPTIDGSTGVVNLPTAEIAPQGTLDLGVTYQTAPFDWHGVPVRVNAGVAKDLELWVGYAMWSDGDDENFLNGGLKYRFLNQAEDDVDLAIGGSFTQERYDTWDFWDRDITKAFLVASKDFDVSESSPITARGTVGVMYNRFKDRDGGDSDNFTKPYVALEVMHKCGASLGLEYRWEASVEDDDGAPFSAVLRYKFPNSGFWAEIGRTNATYQGTSWVEQKPFYGVGYTFEVN